VTNKWLCGIRTLSLPGQLHYFAVPCVAIFECGEKFNEISRRFRQPARVASLLNVLFFLTRRKTTLRQIEVRYKETPRPPHSHDYRQMSYAGYVQHLVFVPSQRSWTPRESSFTVTSISDKDIDRHFRSGDRLSQFGRDPFFIETQSGVYAARPHFPLDCTISAVSTRIRFVLHAVREGGRSGLDLGGFWIPR